MRKIPSFFLAFIIMALMASAPAFCQSAPEIEVNMTVLQDLPIAGSAAQPAAPIKLIPPRTADNDAEELKETISEISKALESLPEPASPPPLAAVSRPVPIREDRPQPPAPQQAVSFPVSTVVRSESQNPAVAGNLHTTLPPVSVPVPIREQSSAAEALPEPVPEAPAQIASSEKIPPVPPRRPAIQKASPAFVAAALEKQAWQAASIEPAAGGSVTPPPGPRGKRVMPAVPKEKVSSEPLAEQMVVLEDGSDPLFSRLRETDRSSLTATIEDIFEQRETQPASRTRRAFSSEPQIVKAQPLKRPANAYVPERVTASLTPMPGEDVGKPISISLAGGFGDEAKTAIMRSVLPTLGDDTQRLIIESYAATKREALSRGLAVRSFLLEKGIEPSRLELRALGMPSDGKNQDRIDFLPAGKITKAGG